MKISFALAILALTLTAPIPALAADLYLVRHAEKELGPSTDPRLTRPGAERADNLAVLLGSAEIQRVFSTDFNRTRDTAAPTARASEVEVELYDPTALEAFADHLLRLEENTLVVGHSDTTPELVGLLGGEPGSPIVEAWEYDRVYVLVVEGGVAARTILLRLPPGTRGRP